MVVWRYGSMEVWYGDMELRWYGIMVVWRYGNWRYDYGGLSK